MLLANWTRSDPEDQSFATAARQQVDFLLNDVPRTESGAISHRTGEVQLWYVLHPSRSSASKS